MMFDALGIRRRLGPADWTPPIVYGEEGYGWRFDRFDRTARILVSHGPTPDPADGEWQHASISHPDTMPTYDELALLHHAVWPTGYAYQVFAPPEDHINIHPYALHLWALPNAPRILPNFGAKGTI